MFFSWEESPRRSELKAGALCSTFLCGFDGLFQNAIFNGISPDDRFLSVAEKYLNFHPRILHGKR